VEQGTLRHGKDIMPRKRQHRDDWQDTRRKVWERDHGLCQGPYCKDKPPLALEECHIDHIVSGKRGTNHISNLRVLCRRCHVLRADNRHRGMMAKAIADGIIPPDWRSLVWEG
jgi:5-methylcytosine-specific restriction endonuclease McrA